MKIIVQIVAVSVFLLLAQFVSGETDNSEIFLSLSKTQGLNENELKRIFLDWSDVMETSRIYQVSKEFLPPKGPYQVKILFDFHPDKSNPRYKAGELTVNLKEKDYRGELLDADILEHRVLYYLDQSATIELHPDLTREENSYLSNQEWMRKYVQFDDTLVPVKLFRSQMYYIWSPDSNVYVIRLRLGNSGESYHLRIERTETSEEVELIHRRGLPII